MNKLHILKDTYGQIDMVWKLNDKIVSTAFNSITRQLFDVEGNCYVYFKDTVKLIKISFDKYITLLLKLDRLVYIKEYYD